ncbi:MAG TPA: hypothetical protein VM689_06025 [Aliidongia sp.]|nr:hypothetical protein [Aliidongia sp.]
MAVVAFRLPVTVTVPLSAAAQFTFSAWMDFASGSTPLLLPPIMLTVIFLGMIAGCARA